MSRNRQERMEGSVLLVDRDGGIVGPTKVVMEQRARNQGFVRISINVASIDPDSVGRSMHPFATRALYERGYDPKLFNGAIREDVDAISKASRILCFEDGIRSHIKRNFYSALPGEMRKIHGIEGPERRIRYDPNIHPLRALWLRFSKGLIYNPSQDGVFQLYRRQVRSIEAFADSELKLILERGIKMEYSYKNHY